MDVEREYSPLAIYQVENHACRNYYRELSAVAE